jgi:hypothetical protein
MVSLPIPQQHYLYGCVALVEQPHGFDVRIISEDDSGFLGGTRPHAATHHPSHRVHEDAALRVAELGHIPFARHNGDIQSKLLLLLLLL